MKKLKLSIPTSCHENWDAMTPNDQGRFCGACNKSVIDFTDMSDRQMIAFFKQPLASVCGRLHPDQLYRDIILPRKRLPWIKYFFQFAVPAFLVSLKATAQIGTTKGKLVAICRPPIVGDTIVKPMVLGRMAPPPQFQAVIPEISGRVVDSNGEPVAFATVMLKGTNTGVQTAADGKFNLKDKNLHGKILVASAVGLKTIEQKIADLETVTLQLSQLSLTGEVVLVAAIFAPRPKNQIEIIQQRIDSAFSRFSVYPNPASVNSQIIINTKKLENGLYSVTIMSAAGEKMQTLEITIIQKAQLVQLQLPNPAPGVHFISLFNKKTNKIFVEKLVLQ